MRLSDLPCEVLARIVGACDQPDKVACMTACKALSAAATAVGAWSDRVTFRDLDASAVAFMARHRCPSVSIDTACPDDVPWFFDKLHAAGVACIRELEVRLSGGGPSGGGGGGRSAVQRVPMDLLAPVARHATLRCVRLSVEGLEDTCEVAFPADTHLPELHTLEIVEEPVDGSRQLIVWFADAHAGLPALETLVLDVGLSDVMAGLRRLPALKRVRYLYDEEQGGETFEDVSLAGLDLDCLETAVGEETAYADLWRELAACTVRRLVLHLMDDWLYLSDPLSPGLRELVVTMHVAHADVKVDFPVVRDLKHLRALGLAAAPWVAHQELHHTLMFAEVAVPEWIRFFGAVHVSLLPATRVLIAPT